MAEIKSEEEDEDSFGEFNFASNHTINPSLNFFNREDFIKNNEDDDDDWGDFVNSSSALYRTESLPNRTSIFSKPPDTLRLFPKGESAELTQQQPDSAPSRIESERRSRNQWVKTQGALPLSIFGEEETEEDRSGGANGDSFASMGYKVDKSANKGSSLDKGAGINDLIASLYKDSEHSKTENGSRTDMKHDVVLNTSTNGKLLNNIKADSGDSLSLDSSWLESSKDLAGGINQANLNWNPLNVEANRSSSSRNASNSGTNTNGNLNDSDGDSDENDGWEFKTAESKIGARIPQHEPILDSVLNLDMNSNIDWDIAQNQNTEVKTGNMPPLGSNESNTSLNFLNLGSVGLNSNSAPLDMGKAQMTYDLPNKSKDFHDDDNANDNDDDDDDDDDGWEFKDAKAETVHNHINGDIEVGEKEQKNVRGDYVSASKNNAVENGDLFASTDWISHNSGGWDIPLDFNTNSITQDNSFFSAHSQSKPNIIQNGLNSYPVAENSWTFKDAYSETGLENKNELLVANSYLDDVKTIASSGDLQRSGTGSGNNQQMLPLSIFGDGEIETDDSLAHQDLSASHNSTSRNFTKSPSSNISINDLISTLYSQAAEKSSADLIQKPPAQDSSFLQTVMDSNQENSKDDIDDESWEFQGAFLGTGAESQIPTSHMKDTHIKSSNQVEFNEYVSFYSKLKDDLRHIVLCHLERLKNVQSTEADYGTDDEPKVLQKEIQDLHNQLHLGPMDPEDFISEKFSPKHIGIDEFVQTLQHPKFQALELEYHLSERLILAQKDWKSAIELLKHAASTHKILTLGSVDEQYKYVMSWSRIVSVCYQELKHGTFIWKQALQYGFHLKVSSRPLGKKYIIALGEICRVAAIIGSATKLYRPWIILHSATNMLALLSECTSLWLTSGLKEALQSIPDILEFDHKQSTNDLIESIDHVGNLDAFTLYNHVLSGQEPICQISLLCQAVIPGLKMVLWNEDHYFITIANLWANLISSDPPTLPHIHIG